MRAALLGHSLSHNKKQKIRIKGCNKNNKQ
jgi:hypothetical protein